MKKSVDLKTVRKIEKLKKLKFKREELEVQIKTVEDELKETFGTDEVLLYHGVQICSYKTVHSHRFNSTAFKETMPDLYKTFLVPSTYRRLLLS